MCPTAELSLFGCLLVFCSSQHNSSKSPSSRSHEGLYQSTLSGTVALLTGCCNQKKFRSHHTLALRTQPLHARCSLSSHINIQEASPVESHSHLWPKGFGNESADYCSQSCLSFCLPPSHHKKDTQRGKPSSLQSGARQQRRDSRARQTA